MVWEEEREKSCMEKYGDIKRTRTPTVKNTQKKDSEREKEGERK